MYIICAIVLGTVSTAKFIITRSKLRRIMNQRNHDLKPSATTIGLLNVDSNTSLGTDYILNGEHDVKAGIAALIRGGDHKNRPQSSSQQSMTMEAEPLLEQVVNEADDKRQAKVTKPILRRVSRARSGHPGPRCFSMCLCQRWSMLCWISITIQNGSQAAWRPVS